MTTRVTAFDDIQLERLSGPDEAPALRSNQHGQQTDAHQNRGRVCSVYRWFIRLLASSDFPDPASQLCSLLVLVGVLLVSVFWFQGIRDKWEFDEQHPTQVVSYIGMRSLPALLGLQFSFDAAMMPPQWTHLRSVTPLLSEHTGLRSAASFVTCTNITIEGLTYVGDSAVSSAFCESLTASGRPVLDPANAPGELDGFSARSLPLSNWALQFTPTFQGIDKLCFQIDVLLNRTAQLSAGLDATPMFSMSALSSPAMLAMHEIASAGLVASPNDPALQWIFIREDYSSVACLPFDSVTQLETATTRTVQVSKSTNYIYDYQALGSTPMSPANKEQNWQRLLNQTQDATERAALQSLKDDPTSHYASALVCAKPRSFIIQEVALFRIYGWGPLISDLGGFLSILSVVLLLLFPLIHNEPKLREFKLVSLLKWYKTRGVGPTTGPKQQSSE